MILLLDAGNSSIVLGVYHDDQLIHHWRMETDRHKTEDEYAMQVKAFFQHVGISFEQVKGLLYLQLCRPLCLH